MAARGVEELDAVVAAVLLELAHHRLGELVRERAQLRVGGDDVVDGGVGALRVAHRRAELVQHREGLRARDFVDQVEANEELRLSAGQLAYGVGIPDLVEQRRGAFAHRGGASGLRPCRSGVEIARATAPSHGVPSAAWSSCTRLTYPRVKARSRRSSRCTAGERTRTTCWGSLPISTADVRWCSVHRGPSPCRSATAWWATAGFRSAADARSTRTTSRRAASSCGRASKRPSSASRSTAVESW